MYLKLRHTGMVTAAALAASLIATPPAFAAGSVPKVFAETAEFWVGGVTPVTFYPGQGQDMSAVTGLTLFADGTEVGTDTAAPWGIDWDTRGFNGLVRLSTRATTDTGTSTTDGMTVDVDNNAPTGLTVRFPRRDGYIGQGGELAVDANDDTFVTGSELIVGGVVVSSKDLAGGGNLDLGWNVKLPNGKTDMTVRVRDKVGNVTALTRSVTVDNDRPVITGSTTAGSAVRGSFKVTLTGYKDASPFVTFEALLDDPAMQRSYGQEGSPARSPSTAGTCRTGSTRSAGAPSTRLSNEGVLRRPLIVDNRAPAVSITKAPKNKAKVKKKFTVTAKATDTYGIAKVQLLVNGKVVTTDTKASYSFTVNPKKYGKKFTVRVRAYDKAGNVRYSSTRTYKR
nr:hypothetical protein GCM10020092_004390 [Actinoplanes digitatis]